MAINQVADQREDLTLRMHCRLADLSFGNEHLPIGAILQEANGRFAQFKRLLDRAPCGPVAALTTEIRYGGQTPIGLTWADLEDSLVFSLGHCAPWSERTIECERHTLSGSCEISVAAASIGNLATSAHVGHWQERIQNYGRDAARSSILYQGNGFWMRMHFHDHPPPHVHIYPRRSDTRDRIARVRVDNGDLMDGSLSSAMDHEISDIITRHRNTLLESWDNIRAGHLPLEITT